MGRGRAGSFGRSIAVGATCLALGLGAALPAAATARADDAAPFSNGRARAEARVARIAPGVGSLELATTSGVSVAEVTNNLAQAQSQVLDLGLIGTSLTAEQCDGTPGPVRPDQLPQPTTVDNRKGDASAGGDELPLAGSALGGGRQEASATTTPSAHATVTDAASTVGPVIGISGGRSDASTAVVDGAARQAEATTSLDLDIAGIVQLKGLRWRALHRTGADPATEGSFNVDSGTAAGAPLPVDQAGPLQDALNAALAPSGITVELPRVEHLTTPNELMRVTPLRVTLKDSPAGKAVLGPGLNLSRAQRAQLFDSLVGAYCKFASALLVGDIGLSVASGTGFLTVEVGGVEATSADAVDGNPFGALPPFTPPVALVDGTSAPASVAPAASRAGATPTAGPAVVRAAADAGPLERVCQSLHPNHAACSRGGALPIGIAGLALTAGVGYLDWRRQRGPAPEAAPA